jgi:hypothetical protein
MKKEIYCLLIALIFLVGHGCDDETISNVNQGPNAESGIIYASLEPYFLTAGPDCTQNRIAIQNVINDAESLNKRLIIDKGVYCVDSTLTIPSEIEIDFSNATIQRESGTTVVFDIIKNGNISNRDSLITLKNLLLDGQYKLDNLINSNDAHRFSGLKLENSKDVILHNIAVTETVNGEHLQNTPAAGIFVIDSEKVTCSQLNAYDNEGTGIIIWNSEQISVDGSITERNKGSGLAATHTHNSEFINLNSFDNKDTTATHRRYSNVTINGKYNKVNNVETSGADGSGLNIGHVGNPSDYAIIDNVHSYENELDGITITDSDNLLISNIHLEGNQRHNLQIHDGSTHVQVNNALIYGYPDFNGGTPFGIYINSGGRHGINNATIYNNYHGIYVHNVTSPVSIGSEVFIYNNGSSTSTTGSGIRLIDSQNVSINGPKIFCDQPVGNKTQKYGIFVSGSDNLYIRADVWDNDTDDYHIQSSGTNNDVVIY